MLELNLLVFFYTSFGRKRERTFFPVTCDVISRDYSNRLSCKFAKMYPRDSEQLLKGKDSQLGSDQEKYGKEKNKEKSNKQTNNNYNNNSNKNKNGFDFRLSFFFQVTVVVKVRKSFSINRSTLWLFWKFDHRQSRILPTFLKYLDWKATARVVLNRNASLFFTSRAWPLIGHQEGKYFRNRTKFYLTDTFVKWISTNDSFPITVISYKSC